MARGKIKEKNGHYYMCIVDNSGRETTRSIKKEFGLSKEPTKKQAEKYLSTKIAELENGSPAYASKMTLEMLLKEFMDMKNGKIKESTIESYNATIKNHILPYIGHIRIDQMNKLTMQRYIDELNQGSSAWEAQYCAKLLKQAFNKAVEWDLMKSNPAQGLELPKHERRVKEIWTDADLVKFLNVNTEDPCFVIYLLAITTGLRRGEILALTWEDVDFEKNTLSVNKTLSRDRKISCPKSKTSIRIVPIPKSIVKALKVHRSEQLSYLFRLGAKNQNNAVFATSAGTYYYPGNVLRYFKKACLKAEVKIVDLHSLRHLHVSMLLAEGVDLKAIQEQVGHAQLSTTLNVYAHLINKVNNVPAEKIEERMNRITS